MMEEWMEMGTRNRSRMEEETGNVSRMMRDTKANDTAVMGDG
jgi:hypothetical protein